MTSDGRARSWGLDDYGDLGYGFTHGTNTPVQVSGVTAAAEAVPAADFQWCDPGEGGERGFAAGTAGVQPADEELGDDDGLSRAPASSTGPAACWADQFERLRVELGALCREELDSGCDGLQGKHGQAVLDRLGRQSR